MWCSHTLRHVSVRRVGQEELPLGRQSRTNVLLPVDVFLAAVHHTNVACTQQQQQSARRLVKPGTAGSCLILTSAQRQQFVFQDVLSICPFIHQVQFCYHTNGTRTCTTCSHASTSDQTRGFCPNMLVPAESGLDLFTDSSREPAETGTLSSTRRLNKRPWMSQDSGLIRV